MSPPNYYRWLVVTLTVINQAVLTGISFYCFAIFSIEWLEQFEISRGQLMLAITFLSIAGALAAPLVGHRLDKMPLLWPVITGYVLFCSGLGLLAIATAYWQVIVVYATFFALGQMLAGIFVSQLLVNRWFAEDTGLALGISATGSSLGGILFPLAVAEVLSAVSLAEVFQTVAVFSLIVLLPLNYFILRVQPPTEIAKQNSALASERTGPTWTTQKILRSRAFWIPLSLLLAVSTPFVAIQSNIGVHLNDLSYPATFTGQMVAVITAMMFVGKLLYGKLADQFDHRYLLFFMGCTSIAAITLLMSTADKATLLASAVLIGIANGGLLPVRSVVFASRFGVASFGKVLGLAMLVSIAGSLGSVYAAWIYDQFGSYDYAFISFVLMPLPGLILLRWLPPPLKQAH